MWVCVNPLFMTSKKCWNMGVTREVAPVIIRQFLHSYWSRATAGTVLPHQVTCVTRTSFPYKELFTRSGRGPYHFIAGGVLCWKKSLTNYNFRIYFTFWPKRVDVFWPKRYCWMGIKVCWIGLQLVLDNLPGLRLGKIIKNQASLGLND